MHNDKGDRVVERLLLNCDMGESFGSWRMGLDAEVMPYIDCANIACGYHAGDPGIMRRTVALALEHGVTIGAHPAYPDLVGFGRRFIDIDPHELADAVNQARCIMLERKIWVWTRSAQTDFALVVVARRLGDFVVDRVVVFVFDERHGVVIVVGQQIVVAVGRAHAGFFRGVGRRVFVLVVRREDRLVAFLVDFRRLDVVFLVLVAVDLLVLDLIFRVLIVGRIAGTGAAAAQLHRLFGIEVGSAFGAVCRATVQVVKLRLAVGADLFGAQFGIGHVWMLSTG